MTNRRKRSTPEVALADGVNMGDVHSRALAVRPWASREGHRGTVRLYTRFA
jgi:hypothetical protein